MEQKHTYVTKGESSLTALNSVEKVEQLTKSELRNEIYIPIRRYNG